MKNFLKKFDKIKGISIFFKNFSKKAPSFIFGGGKKIIL
jgi:hypothetical protein